MKQDPFILALLLLTLAARSLQFSAQHLIPSYDEVHFLDMARGIKNEGVAGPTMLRQDTHHPLYAVILAPFIRNAPRDFAWGKIISLAAALALVLFMYVFCRRRWGAEVALVAAALAALNAITALLSNQLMADGLFALWYCAALFLLFDAQRPWQWFVVGFLAGLAYLTKGNGYFIFVSIFVCAAARYRRSMFSRPALYVASVGFLVTAVIFLAKNIHVWGAPFYNVNNKVFWLDSLNQWYLLSLTPEASRVGWRWFLEHHTLAQIILRWGQGLREMVLPAALAFGVGPLKGVPAILSGCVMMVLGLFGALHAWRKERRLFLAVVPTGAVLFLLFCFYKPGSGSQWRYVYPLAMSFLPMTAIYLVAQIPRLHVVVILAGAVALIFSCQALLKNPLSLWGVPGVWSETSTWIEGHVAPGRYLLSNASRYSNWDTGRDLRQPFPLEVPVETVAAAIQTTHVRFALLDQMVVGFDPYLEKYGPADEHGPTSFMGWPRCFQDSAQPSHFLVYGSDCS